jgi:signal transduction histidine kinase
MAAPLKALAPREPAMETQDRVNILMVDDEEKNLLALEAVLGSLGQNLVKAKSGKEALRKLMQDDFALILLDVQMPEMDGFETASLIRSRDKSRYIPIIFLTAVGKTEEEMFRGYEVGAVDYLLKPFAPEILRYKVTVLVELHRKNEEVRKLNVALKELNASLEARVKERTESLEQRSAELARSNLELEQFAAVASHDLQEPLRTMVTCLQMVEANNRGKLSAEDQESFDLVLKSSKRMRQLILDVLTFSQVGAKAMHFETVDCERLVADLLVQLKGAIAEQEAEIKIGALPSIEGEASLISQVFQNLIGNALKFCREGHPKIELGSEAVPGGWKFWVRDHGIGIHPGHFDKIFKLFRRLHTGEEFRGSGLGLSICKKIVERHGGQIWVESQLGQGATFYFTLLTAGGNQHGRVYADQAVRNSFS